MLNEQARFDVAQEYLRAIEDLNNRVSNGILHMAVDFLQRYCFHVFPRKDRIFHIGEKLHEKLTGNVTSKDAIWVYIYDPADLQYLPENSAETIIGDSKNFHASYCHHNKLISLAMLPGCSRFFRGMILAHESFHVFILSQSKKILRLEIHEYESHCFEHELLLETGGLPYQRLLLQRVDEIREELGGRSIVGAGKLKNFPYPTTLNDVWGACDNQGEQQARKWMLHQHAMFCIIQERDISYAEKAHLAGQL